MSAYDLVRLGPSGDGGYLVPDCLDDIDACFSPGVADTWIFEEEVVDRLSVPCFAIDGSHERPREMDLRIKFERVWLRSKSGPGGVSLGDWVDRAVPSDAHNLLLQMDIEGSEYSVIAAAPVETLSRFKIVIIEFHGLDRLSILPDLLFRMRPAIEKLTSIFDPVHIHVNNASPLVKVRDVVIPPTLEVTFLRHKDNSPPTVSPTIPHPLDSANVSGGANVDLPIGWPW